MATIDLEAVAPEAAIKSFERKGLEISFDWRDVDADEHARNFTVAKGMRLDVLNDIRVAVDDALRNGTTLDQFKKDLTPTLQAKGWWGKQLMSDPLTGEDRLVQLGSPHRLRTIFDVNMRASYAAGKWKRAKDMAGRVQSQSGQKVYLRYVSVRDDQTRPAHANLHGTVLPLDHTFWDTHYPPNGWGCRCTIQIMTERQVKRMGYEVSPDPEVKTREWFNARTGEVSNIPEGIDPGWSHNVGKSATRAEAGRVFAEKLRLAPPDIAALALKSDPDVVAEIQNSYGLFFDDVVATGKARGERRVIGAFSPRTVERLSDFDQFPENAAITIGDKDVLHLLRDAKKTRKQAVSESFVHNLPTELANAKAVLFDTEDPALIYVFDAQGNRKGKLVVRIDYYQRVRGTDGKRRDIRVNAARTAGVVQPENLRDQKYKLLDGEL
ncbi:phage minor head protein [Thalassospira alkalitolerans]|uniref:phage head morphogenesis protein n=1 Tax=Thalassospira alkalitolerans TaxID=1293890 RepID=UPI000A1E35B2|nr:phage minor head protein [Thalassospira alkalitolerans]